MTEADYKKSSRFLDKQFSLWVVGNFSATLKDKDRESLQRISEAVSYTTHLKHSCLDITQYSLLNDVILNSLLKGVEAGNIKKLITDNVKPLICSDDGKKVWLQKYYHFERSAAQDLLTLKNEKRIEIITGGPGTGKTWTAAQRIQQKRKENPDCVIELAAPTGKAANNMMLALGKANLDATGLKSVTLHSLLGIRSDSPKPRRDKQNPIVCDLLVVDEASMIDLPMMTRLLQALPAHAELLLLGDKDQLASVEAGSVLHEICAASVFKNCITTLTKSWRYEHSPEIGVLATALNSGSVADMSHNQKVHLHTLLFDDPWNPPWLKEIEKNAMGSDSIEALQHQKQFQILCALREGPQGVNGINAMIEKKLGHTLDSWYAGKPVMITQNNHDRKLYNGDVGMVLSIDGVLKACFQVDGQVKMISQAQMPEYETCYAITVHKSQGSEYSRVLIVLPADIAHARNNPVLTRELVYTAVTRAKESVDIWCGKGVLENAASKTLQRMSGLAAFL